MHVRFALDRVQAEREPACQPESRRNQRSGARPRGAEAAGSAQQARAGANALRVYAPRALGALAAVFIVACDRVAEAPSDLSSGAELEMPAPEAEPARVYTARSESARATTGKLTLTVTTRMPQGGNERSTDVLLLRAETGLTAEAVLESTLAPSASVEGQTIRALMELPVDASQTLVYRITQQNAPEGGRSLCGEREATRLVVWEPTTPGETALKILALAGEAPGRPGAQLCAVFSYVRPAT
jgi:hypothetical protein